MTNEEPLALLERIAAALEATNKDRQRFDDQFETLVGPLKEVAPLVAQLATQAKEQLEQMLAPRTDVVAIAPAVLEELARLLPADDPLQFKLGELLDASRFGDGDYEVPIPARLPLLVEVGELSSAAEAVVWLRRFRFPAQPGAEPPPATSQLSDEVQRRRREQGR